MVFSSPNLVRENCGQIEAYTAPAQKRYGVNVLERTGSESNQPLKVYNLKLANSLF